MKRFVTIDRCFDFEAAHRLPYVSDGHKCKRMHGHSYVVTVYVTGQIHESGPESGMVVDFGIIDAAAKVLHERVDHQILNDVLHENPTVENVAPIVWEHFRAALDESESGKECLLQIHFSEGPRSGCWFPAKMPA